MSGPAIEVNGLGKKFGRRWVLRDMNLSVPGGQTFALLGVNGAGKTTLIRCLLGLARPDEGSVRVMGIDPARDPVAVRRMIGYLAEDQRMFGWMTVKQTLRFVCAFYPTWNHELARLLVNRFGLEMDAKVRHLSKGQNVRLGLLLALAHEPKLVILDDPTLGLDPIMRKQFLREVVGLMQGGGMTVFFSSHLLYEIEPVADAVAIVHGGRIVRSAATEHLRACVKRLVLPGAAATDAAKLPGVLDLRWSGRQIVVTVEDVAVARAVAVTQGMRPVVHDMNLDEIFEAYAIGRRELRDVSGADLEAVA